MACVFSHVFGCCLQRKTSRSLRDPLDEESHLIPANAESSPSESIPDALIVHQKMKERMNTIVRSKEGKMVNVASRLPFNLHNKNTSASLDDGSLIHGRPSSSRSASSSTLNLSSRPLAHPYSPSPLSTTPHTHGQIHAHVGAPLMSSSSVPQRGVGQGTNVSRSPSMASREHEQNENENGQHSHSHSEHSGSGSMSSRRPLRSKVFNIRLVRGLPLRVEGLGGNSGSTKRGRTRKKRDGEDAEGSPDSSGPTAAAEEESGTISETIPEERRMSGDTQLGSSFGTVHGENGTPIGVTFAPPRAGGTLEAPKPTLSISPASVGEFRLRDTGSLIVSWGD